MTNKKQQLESSPEAAANPPKTFETMFRQSKFVAMGDIQNKFLVGRIVDVVGEDLYIDFGGKFNCVCQLDSKNVDSKRKK